MAGVHKKRMVIMDDDDSEEESIPVKRRRSAVQDDDEDYEEEKADEEEEAEEEAEDYDSVDEYDAEGYKGQADRLKLAAMSALEREQTLADRIDRIERRQETLEIRNRQRERREREKKPTRSSKSRATTAAQGEKQNKLKELAAKRKEGEAVKERERERRAREREVEEEQTDADKERRRQETLEAARREREERETDLRHEQQESAADPAMLERIRIKRDKLESWINEPFFERAMVGCFVRIGIGTGRDGSEPVYRIAEITQVKDGFRPYFLGKERTTKRLELKIGESTKFFQMDFVSNQDFKPKELDTYTRYQKGGGDRHGVTKTQIDEKVAKLKEYKSGYEYSYVEVEAMIAQHKKSGKVKGNATALLAEAEKNLLAAQEKEDHLAVQEAQAEIKRVTKLKEKEKEKNARQGEAYRIADINIRNAEFQKKVESAAGAHNLAEEREISSGRVTASDPFRRLPIRPVIYWNVGQQEKAPEKAADAAPEEAPKKLAVDVPAAEDIAERGQVSPGFAQLMQTPTETPREIEPDDLAMNFETLEPRAAKGVRAPAALPPLVGARAAAHDIDLELSTVPAGRAAPRKRPVSFRPAAPVPTGGEEHRAMLTVTDYKRRMGWA